MVSSEGSAARSRQRQDPALERPGDMLERLAVAIELFHPSLQSEVGHRRAHSENPVRARSSRALGVDANNGRTRPPLGRLLELSH